MINVSSKFRKELDKGNRNYVIRIEMTFANGEAITLKNEDIWQNGITIEEATSASESFDVGSAVIGSCTLVLNNIYQKFDDYDFFDAQFYIYLGLYLEDGTFEGIRKGHYTVDESTYNGSLITLKALDNMYLLDRSYEEVGTTYPATVAEIVRDICSECSLQFNENTLKHKNTVIKKRPEKKVTCREMISYVGQVTCSYAKVNNIGTLVFGWYEKFPESLTDMDGGKYDKDNPYSSGANLEGGSFAFNDGDNFDGGTFEDYSIIYLSSNSNASVSTDLLSNLGSHVYSSQQDKDESYNATSGGQQNAFNIVDNPLIDKDNAQTIADFIAYDSKDLTVRSFNVSSLNDISIEAGDMAYVRSLRGDYFPVYITNLSFTIGAYETYSCGIESPIKRHQERFDSTGQLIIDIDDRVDKKLTDYDKAVKQLNEIATNAMGFFETQEVQEDGSVISYMHDKPKLEESRIVYKKTIDGFFISQDGGKTYQNGFDSQGNAVFNVLAAIGIVCDWIKGGTLTLGGSNNANGKMEVKDARGKTLVRIDETGFTLDESQIIQWKNLPSDVADDQSVKSAADTAQANAEANAASNTTNQINAYDAIIQQRGYKTVIGAEDITTGTFRGVSMELGKYGDSSGAIHIYNGKNAEIVTLDQYGLNVTEGEIQGSTITGSVIQNVPPNKGSRRAYIGSDCALKGEATDGSLVNYVDVVSQGDTPQMTLHAKNQLNIRAKQLLVSDNPNSSSGYIGRTSADYELVTRVGKWMPTEDGQGYISYGTEDFRYGAQEHYFLYSNHDGEFAPEGSVYCTLPVFIAVEMTGVRIVNGIWTTEQKAKILNC